MGILAQQKIVPHITPHQVMEGTRGFQHNNSTRAAFTLAEGATHVAMLPTKMKFAFTLAEVLITLGIIGVVAAMTIPSLMTAHKAQKLRTQFLKSYSTVQQAFKLMINDDVDTDMRNYPGATFYKKFANYLSGVTDCGGYTDGNSGDAVAKRPIGCYSYNIGNAYQGSEPYKYFKGSTKIGDGLFNNGQLMLKDGTLIFFDDGPIYEGWVGVPIYIDINGANTGPNRMGVDFFGFEVTEGIMRPMGDKDTRYYGQVDKFCNVDAKSSPGYTCTLKALHNTDYFKIVVKKVK